MIKIKDALDWAENDRRNKHGKGTGKSALGAFLNTTPQVINNWLYRGYEYLPEKYELRLKDSYPVIHARLDLKEK